LENFGTTNALVQGWTNLDLYRSHFQVALADGPYVSLCKIQWHLSTCYALLVVMLL